MTRRVTVLGAPSSLGIRPYDDGGRRRVEQAPRVLREQGLVERLGARDAGDVEPPPYVDFERPSTRPRNEEAVAAYSRDLGARVAASAGGGDFTLVLGGECSVVLGCLLGLTASRDRVGLAYVDAHADFATPEESLTGSVASMCLAMAVGRGDTPLARLGGVSSLVSAGDVALVGRRDEAEGWYGHDALLASEILDLPKASWRNRSPSDIASLALTRLGSIAGGFWIHLDADVLDPTSVPAVDSPIAGGLDPATAAELLTPIVRHPRARGLALTIYDPGLDADRASASALVELLTQLVRTD